ncbi:RNA 2',3'-cyclic phosphodiesterase [Alteromonas halophila]|uniref:RNA 2',3'-cyclic phosphodiesterase n=1 Tax=Alteromonas halophila TaxID=516698 RepID=A0A918JFP0_9ALTE|nr:RNA 2',3'-cyclic phosphodiesterase [Alteromonas halophila]GGW78502.1 hypothetical protein GCM10007391_08890 [Alteromonas halophila]
MRTFIGLDLAPAEKMALDTWRQQALPEIMPRPDTSTSSPKTKKVRGKQRVAGVAPASPYAVPAANYHMTLCFLGHISDRQHEALCQTLNDIVCEPFDVHLDASGIWSGPKILFAAPQTPPQTLFDLAKYTRKAARQAGIDVEGRDYKPHVTLIRKASATTPVPLFAPDVLMQIQGFHLFESVSTPSGVTYPIRHSWALRENLSVREKLKRGLL